MATHDVEAVYSATGNFLGNASGTVSHTVNQGTAAVALASSAGSAVYGQAVTFTATVTGGATSGTVTFSDGGTPLGSVALDGSGRAALTTSALALGSRSITATYGGDADLLAATSGPASVSVAQAGTQVVLVPHAVLKKKKVVSLGLEATIEPLAPGGGVPTGTVTFELKQKKKVKILGTVLARRRRGDAGGQDQRRAQEVDHHPLRRRCRLPGEHDGLDACTKLAHHDGSTDCELPVAAMNAPAPRLSDDPTARVAVRHQAAGGLRCLQAGHAETVPQTNRRTPTMANSAADENLLFGLLALQNGLIDQTAWSPPSTPGLARRRGRWPSTSWPAATSTRDQRGLLEGLVAPAPQEARRRPREEPRRRQRRPVDPREPGQDRRPRSRRHARPRRLAPARRDRDDADRTGSYSVGTATGDGQRFRVLRPHARGGLGAVFVALDAELNREVALKQILDHHADDPTSRTRFLLEAEITGGLEHPGIVPVYGLGTYGDGRPYYAMRFIRGDSLKEAIAAFHADESLKGDPGRRSLELRKLLRRFVDVCNAIDYAHSRGVLHRDIKPANVIVGKHGETLVVDWGLAKALGKAEPGDAASERTLMPVVGQRLGRDAARARRWARPPT